MAILGNVSTMPVPDELRNIEGDLVLEEERGATNYAAALSELIKRFEGSAYCKSGRPAQGALVESVRLTIKYFGDVFPPSADNRPLSVPELSLIFGAVIGYVSAGAYRRKKATLEDIEAQLEVAWLSMREWLPRGVYMLDKAQKAGVIRENDE